ncbi:MAG TPA: methyl-accepting chemotaxis protein [Alphaproteobacteria bacterium]|nr:methyl-accepting chemotaxis protein [Alphaproteobacteria bacterium]HNS43767.1 methyl-accepting chemotaxis protein [Alphaproteobacteria bacterium]
MKTQMVIGRLWLVVAAPALLYSLFIVVGNKESSTYMAGLGLAALILTLFAFFTVKSLRRMLSVSAVSIQSLADGKMESVHLEVKGSNDFAKIAQAVMALKQKLHNLEKIEQTSREVLEQHEQLVAHRHEKQEKLNGFIGKNMKNIESLASSMEEMTASIREIGDQVARAVTLVDQTRSVSESSTGKVQGLGTLTKEIDTVVDLIREIAEKTNLLALNATIEAARAGEAGRGFSVVAGEVKVLSSQTTEATGSINSQVQAIQNESATVVNLIEEINNSIGGVFEVSRAISEAISQQGVAANEISHNANKIAEFSRRLKDDIEELTKIA